MSYFITGTDTNVGKTYLTCLLLRALRAAGLDAVGFKPICCGDRDDAQALLDASLEGRAHARPPAPSSPLTLEQINPVFYPTPVAPFAAAQLANRPVDLPAIQSAYQSLAASHDLVLVEGVGGWEVPLSENQTVADLATMLNLPVLLVVANRLGALNHTLLTAKAIRDRSLPLKGLILNHLEDELDTATISNPQILRQTLPHTPILAEILHGDTTLDPSPFLPPPTPSNGSTST
jgi:dethiobiotin synthetase